MNATARSRLLFAAIATVGVASGLLLAGQYLKNEREYERLVIEDRAHALHHQLQRRFTLITRTARAAAAYFAASGDVSPVGFARFYDRSASDDFQGAIRGIAFLPVLRQSDRHALADHVARTDAERRALGYPDFAVSGEGRSERLMPAILVEPAASRDGILGFDIASSPVQLKTALAALRENRSALTGPVSLPQDAAGVPPGLIYLSPVSLPAAPHAGLPTDAGLVAIGISPQRLVDKVVHEMSLEADCVSLRFAEDDTDLAAHNRVGEAPSGLARIFAGLYSASPRDLDFGGRRIVLDYTGSFALRAGDRLAAVSLLGLCLLATAFALLYVRRFGRESEIIAATLAGQRQALRSSERRLAQVQKEEALGKLVGGVAHDFNNILAVVLGNAELLEEPLGERERKDCIDEIKRSADRGSALSRQLLAFGQRAMLEPRDEPVEPLLRDLATMLRRVLPAPVTIEVAPAPDTRAVFADTHQLSAALLCLAINASDAMPEGGTLSIDSAEVDLDGVPPEIEPGRAGPAAGRYVVFTVRDTGRGMTDEQIRRAFDPFYTTKPVGQGSGLGLSMVLGFARQSGGTVQLESRVGAGTVVRLYVPAGQSAAAQPQDAPVAARGVHILVSEDEIAVREMLRRQLVAAGHSVSCAPNGEAALRMLSRGLAPDILLTDMVMPGSVQGADLARRATQMLPGLRTIYISGYSLDKVNGTLRGASGVVLQKPVRRTDLLRAVAASLADAGMATPSSA